jgi:pilus assembly protein Flp/PilA
MLRFISAFLADQNGATAIEYALIASLISITILTAVTLIGTTLSNTFNTVASSL